MASVVQKMALCGISSAPNIGVAGSSETWVSTYKPGGGGGGGGGVKMQNTVAYIHKEVLWKTLLVAKAAKISPCNYSSNKKKMMFPCDLIQSKEALVISCCITFSRLSKGLRNSQEYSVFIRNVNPRYQKFDSRTYFIGHKDYINN